MPGRLRERLGEEFLRSVPASPGVYLLLGEAGELLYVGKAKNLRTRIRSYTRLTANADPRLVSLVAKVRTVRWEVAASEADAIARETQLLRGLRPPFNRTHAARSGHLGIGVAGAPKGVRLRMSANGPLADEVTFCCYPFEAGTPDAFVALARVLAVVQPGVERPRVPSRVTQAAGFEVALEDELRAPLRSFLGGRSPGLLGHLSGRVAGCPDPLVARSAARELEVLRKFYAAGPRHVRRLQLRHGASREVVDDDVLTRLIGASLVEQVGATVADARPIEEMVGAWRRNGFRFGQIADRLNRDAVPRVRGGGRWSAADVAEVVGGQLGREISPGGS